MTHSTLALPITAFSRFAVCICNPLMSLIVAFLGGNGVECLTCCMF